MTKKDKKLIILDLERRTFEMETTGRKFYGEGGFGVQPDQVMFGPTRKFLVGVSMMRTLFSSPVLIHHVSFFFFLIDDLIPPRLTT